MNATRRLEEFLFKLDAKQKRASQSDKMNKLEINANIDDLKITNEYNYKKASCIINNK